MSYCIIAGHTEIIMGNVSLSWFLMQQNKKTNSVAFSLQAKYRLSDHHLLAKFSPNFCGWGVSHGQRGGYPTVINLSFLDRNCTFLPSSSSFILTRAEWTPFQTHCYPENLAAPGIESGTSGYAARKSDH
jgi:hypothetical protein